MPFVLLNRYYTVNVYNDAYKRSVTLIFIVNKNKFGHF